MSDARQPIVSASFINHLRQSSRVSCPVAGCGEAFPATDDQIRAHISLHPDFTKDNDIEIIVTDIKRGRMKSGLGSLKRLDAESSNPATTPSIDETTNNPVSTSMPPLVSSHRQSQANSFPPPRRSRPRPYQLAAADDPDLLPREPQRERCRAPKDDQPPSVHHSPYRPTKPPSSVGPGTHTEECIGAMHLPKQPKKHIISEEQLVAEVKDIYAGLMMVEAKCIELDKAQAAPIDTELALNNEQWNALIALHRTLLHEHHDFFLASQHPSASHALKQLATKYAMPARMWRHGIHSFLELLRHRLPVSLEHMLTFIYLAYSMMALLYETVPAFEDTWIECLGDLARYRMAIEEDDIRDREAWTNVSRHWYSKASRKSPTTGRLYHHLAILARPNALQQLFYYFKSLCVPIPLSTSRSNIEQLFQPILDPEQRHYGHPLIKQLRQHISSHELLLISHDVNIFPVNSGSDGNLRLASLVPRLSKRIRRSLQYCILSFLPSLASTVTAAATTSATIGDPHTALQSGQLGKASNVSSGGDIAWLLYPTIVTAILAGEFAAVHFLGDPLLLHGVSMAISAGAFLLMVFSQAEVPFYIQFSTWGMCAILTIAYTYHDTLGLQPEMRRLAVFAVIIVGFLLDSGISSVCASAGNPVFASNDSPSTAFMFAAFLLPCMAMSAFLCSGTLGLYRQVTQHWARTSIVPVPTEQRPGV
ncbi:hypothetical protein F4777DRAFT_554571 [Nemania sp. FL0916]|nr:hypothetical protein F4777DRAFT_554571 [Nemania sp. FL0916]